MQPNSPKNRPKGFALIVTLSLMILLTVIAVGLLTLSSISLRATSRGTAQSIANSNARLALLLAIGDLQKTLGPDQAVSANASSLNEKAGQPNAVGAWQGYGWDPEDPTKSPMPGDKAGKFKSWLVSAPKVTDTQTPGFADGGVAADSIWLNNPATSGNTGSNTTEMRAARVPVSSGNNRGGYAWMVSDNSTKATIGIENKVSESIAENVAYRTAAPSPRPDVLDSSLDALSGPPVAGDKSDFAKIITMSTAVLAVDPKNREEITGRSQSLASNSLGLLTDPVSGGLKTDLTPYMEGNADSLGKSPYFAADLSSGDQTALLDSGAPTWTYLQSHYQLYKSKVRGQKNGTPQAQLGVRDLAPVSPLLQAKPASEVLLPVIAKLQIMFSLVSHHSHIGDRVQAFNNQAQPPGNQNHAVPHLAYDPVITLYNPYDVGLDLSRLRIRVSDPPVGFQFQKHDKAARRNVWYRQEFATGEFQGLARFQLKNEHDPNARKYFILDLTGGRGRKPGGSIVLLPGEVKVFSPYVENNWTWGLETAGGYTPHAFFDWNANDNLGTKDYRTDNKFGVSAIPGLDFRAGFQTDHLSYSGGRPDGLDYSWAKGNGGLGGGWVSLKTTDSITVNCRPQRTVNDRSLPDFKVEILARSNVNPESDVMRTFDFRMADPALEMSTTGSPSGIITRTFDNFDLLQELKDESPGGKSPFALFTMAAKTTKDVHDDSKAWAFNNFVVSSASQDSRVIGNAVQSYDLRLQEVQDFTQFPGIEYDSDHQRGYFGAIARPSEGVSVVPMYRVPVAPAASLGNWIGSNLVMSGLYPRVNYPLGNSFAHPLIPAAAISASSPVNPRDKLLDHSYLMNAALWDRFYFSSATDYDSEAFESETRQKGAVLDSFFDGSRRMLNSRLTPYIGGAGDAAKLAADFKKASDEEFATTFAANAMIDGAFNVNSDSVDAWRSILSSLRDTGVTGYLRKKYNVKDKTAFVRNGLPVAGSSDDANPENSVNALGAMRWAGYRSLDDGQITSLATNIVKQIRARGKEDGAPSLSLGGFVNRRLGSPGDLQALKGILQTAIDLSGINDKYQALDSKTIDGSTLAANRITGLANVDALDGFTADGAAPMLSQGDLLTALAPIVTVRGDTFTIRSYGEARDSSGRNVIARAWCEATVQRIPQFVDPSDPPETAIKSVKTTNATFGRRFVVTSFRWLNSSEI